MNLFSALHKYVPRKDHSPQENQITEMLAQMFAHEPEFCCQLFRQWFPKHAPLTQPVVKTQLTALIEEDGQVLTKFIDLAVFDEIENQQTLAFVVEIKWWSGENWSRDEKGELVPQTKFYDRFIERYKPRWPEVRKVYLTRRVDQPADGWTPHRWADVHRFATEYIRGQSDVETFGIRLLREFVDFLEEQNVAEYPLVQTDLAQLQASVEIYQKMERLFGRLTTELTKKHAFPSKFGMWVGKIGSDIVRYGHYATYADAGASRFVHWSVSPSPAAFRAYIDRDMEIAEGVPVVTVRVGAKPGSNERQQLANHPTFQALCEKTGWRVAPPDMWTLVHASQPLPDLPQSQGLDSDTLDDRIVSFFLTKYQDVVETGVHDFMFPSQS